MTVSLTYLLRRFFIVALAAVLVSAVGLPGVHAAGTDDPPADTGDKKKKKGSATDQAEQQLAHEKFLRDYRAARELILAGSYRAGIAAMHAIGNDAHPDVANYIGYAYRKLGSFDNSKLWYEAALKADPNHARTWSYYGMWQAEQGNRLKALDHLAKVKSICGNDTCEDFRQLKAVIDGKASY